MIRGEKTLENRRGGLLRGRLGVDDKAGGEDAKGNTVARMVSFATAMVLELML